VARTKDPPRFFSFRLESSRATSAKVISSGPPWIDGTHNDGFLFSVDMSLGPFVAFVYPGGRVGSTAEILGQGLTGSTSVTFNGLAATSFTVVSDTYMTAVVPAGAMTGAVVVTTPGGIADQ
jgi:hypothetical protein